MTIRLLRLLYTSWLRLLNVLDQDWIDECTKDGLYDGDSLRAIRAEIQARRCRIAYLEAM